MSARRPLCPAERMVDVLDRAATMSFTVIAKLRGEISERALDDALRALEIRHPLLRARIDRSSKEPELVPGEAAPIPLRVREAPEDAWIEHAQASLAHRVWDDRGPRAELTWLPHGAQRSTLLLCKHHVISDAGSGMIAMRDLLRLLQGERGLAVVESPGQAHFLPEGHGNLRWKLRAAKAALGGLLGPKPYRFSPNPSAERAPHLLRFTLDAERTSALTLRARQDGATVHGALCAALIGALAAHGGEDLLARLLHPTDLRRLLPRGQEIGDAVGYYVSSLDTQHRVARGAPLAALAKEITLAVRESKARGEPLLTAPIQGPFITTRIKGDGDLRAFRDYAERTLMFYTLSLTNLGPLARYGLVDKPGSLELEDIFYVAAGTVLGSLGASASSFEGRLSLCLQWVEPMVPGELARAVFEQARADLLAYAAGTGARVTLPS